MSKIGDLYMELEDYVREAIATDDLISINGIIAYLQKNHPDFPLEYNEEVINNILDVINSDGGEYYWF